MALGMVAVTTLMLAGGAWLVWVRRRWMIVVVEGPSMSPTLVAGDRIRASRVPPSTVQKGDIVVARSPGDQRLIVKRIAAAPGDPSPLCAGFGLIPHGSTVPAGQYLLLGDNAADSNDSRIFGYVPAANIVGVLAASASLSQMRRHRQLGGP